LSDDLSKMSFKTDHQRALLVFRCNTYIYTCRESQGFVIFCSLLSSSLIFIPSVGFELLAKHTFLVFTFSWAYGKGYRKFWWSM